MADITLYGPSFSSFLRSVRLLCHFKGLSTTTTLSSKGIACPPFSEAHAELHPFRKFPVLIEGDLILPETLAIADYIDSKPGPSLYPTDAKARALALSDGSMLALYFSKPVLTLLVLEFGLPKGENGEVRLDVAKANLPEVERLLSWLNKQLERKSFYSAGQFTYSDAVILPVLDYLEQLPKPFNAIVRYPQLLSYLGFHRQQAYCDGVLGPADLSDLKPAD